jgi:hypothetical protein
MIDRTSKEELLGQISQVLPFMVWPISDMEVVTFTAMHTTTGALVRVLHLLPTHPDVQRKLRQEIVDARSHGNLEYNELSGCGLP